jgi:hypothetical protein
MSRVPNSPKVMLESCLISQKKKKLLTHSTWILKKHGQ